MTVDLRTCVPGQLVELRDGRIVRYDSKNQDTVYPHLVDDSSRTDDGYFYSSRKEDQEDVVRILPLAKPEQPKSDAHPSVAWWESCPWITDRQPTEEDGDERGWVIIKIIDDSRSSLSYWKNVKEGKPWIHRQGWKRQTSKEKALALIAKHKDSPTVGVWVPTPNDWDIIREGLTE